MATISKQFAKKLRAREKRDAIHALMGHDSLIPTPPAQLSKFPDINVCQEVTNHFHAYQLCTATAPTCVIEPPTNKQSVSTAALKYNPEQVSLEELDRAHFQLVQDLL